ncbi:hypothetical protein ACFOMD_12540 [Sphingoaurantiacus capsulatus]|uniref:Glycerophosphotransferase n=1 Tax=Sphingoaurantiacus capsulatus TaxID=1771310 RepID=A0ABV7XBX7_9SPHN
MKSVAFLYIGGPHHVFHAAPAAAALAKAARDVQVVNLVSGERSAALIERVYAAYDAPPPDIRPFDTPWWGGLAARISGRASARKLPALLRHRRELAGFDALVTAECSSSILRHFGLYDAKMVLIPHGAGDRAISIEKRMALFDKVIVAGPKNAERMVDCGVVRREDLAEVGYLKLDLMRQLRGQAPKLFDNDRPTIFYNPHFKRELSSLMQAEAIVAAFRAQDRFNLVLAPHIRAFEDATPAERMQWEALAEDGKVIVDLGSDRLLDMSYAIGADIYLGDVSSQVYEFLADPRPCVFVNAHGVRWEGDPNYAFWTLGDVCTPEMVLQAVTVAADRHASYLQQQRAAVAASFGESDGAADRAASQIRQLIGDPEMP